VKKYNDYLLESFKNSFLLLEGYIHGSDDLLEKLRHMRSLGVDKSTIDIIDNLIEIFEDAIDIDDSKITQNYFDLVDSADDKVSFIQNNRVRDYDGDSIDDIYKMSGRGEIKIGRIVKQLLGLNNISVTDAEVEKFVNLFKASTVNHDFKFILVSGDDILEYYDKSNYYSEHGSLGNSCMNNVGKSILKIYIENPKKVKLLVLVDGDNKVHGRALVWKLKKSPCDTKYFMDKIYTNKIQTKLDLKTLLVKRIGCIDITMLLVFSDNWKFKYKDKVYYGEISVKLDGNFRRYPYLDTLSFLSKDKDELSNLPDKKSYWLMDTEGEKEKCDYCNGKMWRDDEEVELCHECCVGHMGLKTQGVETKWNKKYKIDDKFSKLSTKYMDRLNMSRLDELFDDPDIRDANELGYITGDLSPEKVSKWERTKSDDVLLDRILFSCPFILGLNWRRSGNILDLGFRGDLQGGFYHFTCEVVEYRNGEFGLNVYAKCLFGGKKVWDENLIKRTDNFIVLCSILNRDVLDLLVRFNNFLKSEFKISHYDIDQEGTEVFNPRLN
jgi:hypothetical protein